MYHDWFATILFLRISWTCTMKGLFFWSKPTLVHAHWLFILILFLKIYGNHYFIFFSWLLTRAIIWHNYISKLFFGNWIFPLSGRTLTFREIGRYMYNYSVLSIFFLIRFFWLVLWSLPLCNLINIPLFQLISVTMCPRENNYVCFSCCNDDLFHLLQAKYLHSCSRRGNNAAFCQSHENL